MLKLNCDFLNQIINRLDNSESLTGDEILKLSGDEKMAVISCRKLFHDGFIIDPQMATGQIYPFVIVRSPDFHLLLATKGYY
jgi:hypothetical protein